MSPDETTSLLRLHHVEGWPVGTIGAQIGRHHDTVEGVLAHAGLGVQKQVIRTRLVDPRLPFVKETLEKYPKLRSSRLWSMAKARGYTLKHRGLDLHRTTALALLKGHGRASSAARRAPVHGRGTVARSCASTVDDTRQKD
ncbi:MAG: hypothetical protein ABJE95_38280 [Byssovorax sp.]